MLYEGFEAIIGLECHAQLRTRSKMFCGCPVEFGAEPNEHTCPVCLGFPGALPVINAAALEMTALAGLMLSLGGCSLLLDPLSPLLAAALLSGAAGVLVGLPALRLKGIYLAIATMAFGFIVEEIITRWEHVTGGNSGKQLKQIDFFGAPIDSDARFYYLCLGLTVIILLGLINLMRSPTGRAWAFSRCPTMRATTPSLRAPGGACAWGLKPL